MWKISRAVGCGVLIITQPEPSRPEPSLHFPPPRIITCIMRAKHTDDPGSLLSTAGVWLSCMIIQDFYNSVVRSLRRYGITAVTFFLIGVLQPNSLNSIGSLMTFSRSNRQAFRPGSGLQITISRVPIKVQLGNRALPSGKIVAFR